MTFNHTSARCVANGGFAQKVPLPSNPSSSQLASYHSTEHDVYLPIVFSKLTYTVPIPKGAIIADHRVLLTTNFNGTTPAIEIGSVAAGTDIMASTALTGSSRTLPSSPLISGGSADGQTLFVTITGTSITQGAGFLVISYMNPPALAGSVND